MTTKWSLFPHAFLDYLHIKGYYVHMAKIVQQFKVIIEQDEDGFFTASVPALPGCYTQAKNLTTLKERVREAISLCLEVSKTDGDYRKRLQDFSYEPSFVGLETVGV